MFISVFFTKVKPSVIAGLLFFLLFYYIKAFLANNDYIPADVKV